MARRFDHYVIVDWSAASVPKTGRDSIWVCHRGPDGERCDNPPTRYQAKLLLSEILGEIAARGERVVVGFDFPFGYPAGFARRLGLGGEAPWRAVWDEIAQLLEDDEQNRNNRFAVGAMLNRRVSAGRFPFWGCPAGKAGEFIGARHHRAHTDSEPLQERRLIDLWMVGAQPCWKLAYTGSVGSQALTGIPVVRALRDDPRWASFARIWPFEIGFQPPPDAAAIVFAEVWPSWWRREIRPDYGPPNDRAQVRSVAEIFAAADAGGELSSWFLGGELSPEQSHVAATEEAWTLGVVSPRRRPELKGRRVSGDPGTSAAAARSAPCSMDRPAMAMVLASVRADPPSTAARAEGSAAAGADAETACGIGMAGIHREGRNEPGDGKTRTHRRSSDQCGYEYLRDPAAIYRESFAQVRTEADLTRFPKALQALALRLAHAAGDVTLLENLAWSRAAVAAGRRALAEGAPVLVDSEMVAAGVIRAQLPAANPVICTLHDPSVPSRAERLGTTRSAAAVELWHRHLQGAVVAIGNAPTALFRLLELLAEGADRPALILGFPVGFVGAAEAKDALIGFGRGVRYIALRGRRGGSALAAAAVNALALSVR